jgi:hypothetical protein
LALRGGLRDGSFDYDPAGGGELAGTDLQSLLRKIHMRLIHVEVKDWLSSSNASRTAGWFSERSSHSFLKSVGTCGGDHAVFSEDYVRVRSQANYVACLAKLIKENLVRRYAGCLERVVANLDRSLDHEADLVVVGGLGVAHGELRNPQCGGTVNVLAARVRLTARGTVIATFQHSSLGEAIR